MDSDDEPTNNGSDNLRDLRIHRRAVLKKIACAFAGISIGLIGVTRIIDLSLRSNNVPVSASIFIPNNSKFTTDTSVQPANELAGTYNTIKLVYFGMATQTTGTKQEYVVLNSPSFLQDLLSEIKRKHPVFGPMLSTMQIVINGNPTQGNPELVNHDEVDFIPVLAGG